MTAPTGPFAGPPEAVAIVGASERQFFARWAVLNLQRSGFAGRILPVNRRAEPVFGLTSWSSVDELPHDPDFGVIAVRPDACLDAARALASRGCRTMAVISDGFGETGTEEGAALERSLVAWARSAGVVLLGPNGVGLADLAAGVQAIGMPMPEMAKGTTSLISQSGGLLSSMADALGVERLGIDLALSLGNGAAYGLADALEACAERKTTETVVTYVETLGDDAARVMRAVDRLTSTGRDVVVVKPGRSVAARRVVQSHTASIAGDDAAVGALLERHGVVRVDDIGDLARAAKVARLVPARNRRGIAVLGASGGSASIVGDLAMLHGVPLPEFGDATHDRLRELIPASGHVGNPVDLSGRAADVPQDAVYRAIADDERVGVLLVPFSAPFPTDDPARHSHRDYLELLAGVAGAASIPLVVASMGPQRPTEWVHAFEDRHRWCAVVEGMGATMRALGALVAASPAAGPAGEVEPGSADGDDHSEARGAATRDEVWSEADGRGLLEGLGVPVVPGILVRDASDARDPAITRSLRYPVAVKAVMPGVAHKARLGGVELGVMTAHDVGLACERIAERTRAHGVEPTGFLVQEMVSGIELLVGLVDNPIVGPIITIGLGGALAETTDHHASGVLPIDAAGLRRVIDRAGLTRLLADRVGAVTETVLALCDAAAVGRLGRVAEIEINPLFVTSGGLALAGDVLVITHGGDIDTPKDVT